MKILSSRLFTFTTIILATGALLLAFGLRKTITLSIDGNEETLNTRALTVGAALRGEGIQLSPVDSMTPSMGSILKNGEKIIIERARRIYILRDGEHFSFVTSEDKLLKILSQANITLNPEDQIYINSQIGRPSSILPQGHTPIVIQIEPAVPIEIISEAGEQILYTSAPTLIDALWDAGIVVESTDQLSLTPDTSITANLAVKITRGQPILIRTQSGSLTIYSAASTVGEVLAHAGLSLQGLDYSIPSPDKPIPVNGEIQLIHLREEVIIEHTPVAFETEYQPAEDLELDTRSTIQPGEYGLIAQRVRIRYKDGVEVSRNLEDEWVAREPKPRIVGYGTKIVKRVADTPDGPIEYWRALSMYAVSYHPVNDNDGTASGLPLKKGIAAVDRQYIPFYTRMYIPGYGEAVAADVGGGVRGRMIDLGYTNEDYVPWHQWVTVYFLWPPPDDIVWIIP
jgi:resuscitation-promoting factor RpfB